MKIKKNIYDNKMVKLIKNEGISAYILIGLAILFLVVGIIVLSIDFEGNDHTQIMFGAGMCAVAVFFIFIAVMLSIGY